MSDFNFGALTDRDFERLAIDIISEIENTQIKLFKPGKDGGIDGFFTDKNGGIVIVQAKHYWLSGLPKLLKHCIDTESTKVNNLNPSRYIFVCSSGLSPNNMKKIKDGVEKIDEVNEKKSEIKAIFNPFIKNIDDIYGLDDLNLFLSDTKNSHIVEKNYKLWMTSTSVLKLILNNGVHARSNSKLEDIVDNLKYYVTTKNHQNAINKLSESNSLVITGEPGIGKTTLAEQICNTYAAKGYQFIEIKSMNMAWDVFDQNIKQIFYFDDFLGANYLEVLENNQDSDVIDFMSKVKKDNTKKFILTSRTSILTQGKDKSIKFKVGKLDRKEYLVNIDSISYYEKSEILYNHIYHSKLPDELASLYFTNTRHQKVINHQNYNPRLIDFITDVEYSASDVDIYWDFVIDNLNNPSEIWKQAIENQLKQYHRYLLYIICLKTYIGEQVLKNVFEQIIKKRNNFDTENEFPFTHAVRLLTGSYIIRERKNNEVYYRVINPSLTDYILPNLLQEPNIFIDLVINMQTVLITGKIQNIFYSKITSIDNLIIISKRLLNHFNEKNINNDLTSFLINFISDKKTIFEIDNSVINSYISTVNLKGICSYREIETLTYISANEDSYDQKVNWDDVIINACKYPLDHEDLIQLTNLISDLSENRIINNIDITEHITEAIIDYWNDEFNQRANNELNVEVDVSLVSTFNENEIENEIEQEVNIIADNLLYEYSEVHNCSSSDIVGSFDEYTYLKEVKTTYDDAHKILERQEYEDGYQGRYADEYEDYYPKWFDMDDRETEQKNTEQKYTVQEYTDNEKGDNLFSNGLPER